jgi:hypothetical protein
MDTGFTSDYVGTIQKVLFAESDFGNLQATFTNRYDTPIVGDDGEMRDTRPEFYTVGGANLWRAVEGGSAFTSSDGDSDKRIRINSQFGELVNRIGDLVGREELLDRAPLGVDDIVPLYQSETYEGLRFHWITEGAGKKYSFNDRATGELKEGYTKGRQMPVEYLPGGEQLKLAAADFNVEALGLDDETLGDLRTLAAGEGFDKFQKSGISLARGLQGTDTYGTLIAALSDREFYETLRG